MSESYKNKKAKLRNSHVHELKPLEKELRKKKGKSLKFIKDYKKID